MPEPTTQGGSRPQEMPGGASTETFEWEPVYDGMHYDDWRVGWDPMNVQLTADNVSTYSINFEMQFMISLNQQKLTSVLSDEHARRVIPAFPFGDTPLPSGHNPECQEMEDHAYSILMYGLALHPAATSRVCHMKVHDAVKELRLMFAQGRGPTQLHDELVALKVGDNFPD
jgi:hypothetical protein